MKKWKIATIKKLCKMIGKTGKETIGLYTVNNVKKHGVKKLYKKTQRKTKKMGFLLSLISKIIGWSAL